MSDYDQEPPWEQQRGTGFKPNRQSGGSSSGGDHTQEAIRSGKYTEVKTRLQQFYAAYPTGAIVTTKVKAWAKGEIDDLPRIMVEALAYRTPDDPHPGTGTSWMVLPGKTPYTNGSEVENCETSAWGRAMAAVGIGIDQGVASAQEIRMHGGGEIEPPSLPGDQLAKAAREAAGAPEPATSATPDAAGQESTTETVPGAADAPPADDRDEPGMTAEEATAKAAAETHIKPKRASRAKSPEPVPMPGGTAPAPAAPSPLEEEAARIQAEDKKGAAALTEAVEQGVDYEEFRRLAREKFIPDGHLAATARWMIESGRMPAVGSVREMTNQQRLVLLMAAVARMDDEEAKPNGK